MDRPGLGDPVTSMQPFLEAMFRARRPAMVLVAMRHDAKAHHIVDEAHRTPLTVQRRHLLGRGVVDAHFRAPLA